MGAQKNRLIETVLLSTHNICFGREIRKFIFNDMTGLIPCIEQVILYFSQFDVFTAASLYAIFSFGVIGVEEVFSVWCSTEIRYGQYILY